MKPTKISDIEQAFPARVDHLLPPWDSIPKEFKNLNSTNRWVRVVKTWFFHGYDATKLVPVEGIDKNEALTHLKTCLRSWQPSHEHKTAGVAYLLSLWFQPVEK